MSVSFDFVSRQQNSEETNQNQRSYFIPDENIYRTGTRCVFSNIKVFFQHITHPYHQKIKI